MLFFDDDINFNVKALIIKENMKIIGKGMQILKENEENSSCKSKNSWRRGKCDGHVLSTVVKVNGLCVYVMGRD